MHIYLLYVEQQALGAKKYISAYTDKELAQQKADEFNENTKYNIIFTYYDIEPIELITKEN